jgi:hypothetical protein
MDLNGNFDINNNYFTSEPEYNTAGYISPNSPINQFNKVVENTIENVKSKYTPDTAPRWFFLLLRYKDMVYNSYMVADCNFRNSTPNEKLSYALREMMLMLEPINIL